MKTTFKVIVETAQGRIVYLAAELAEAITIFREQLNQYADSQICLMREMLMLHEENIQTNSPKVEQHKKIDRRFLQQVSDGADPSNPFYGKIVVMSGTFEQINMERVQVAEALQKLGAKINRDVSKTMNVFVTGNKPGPSKLKDVEQLRTHGSDIKIISQIELKEIINKYIH